MDGAFPLAEDMARRSSLEEAGGDALLWSRKLVVRAGVLFRRLLPFSPSWCGGGQCRRRRSVGRKSLRRGRSVGRGARRVMEGKFLASTADVPLNELCSDGQAIVGLSDEAGQRRDEEAVDRAFGGARGEVGLSRQQLC